MCLEGFSVVAKECTVASLCAVLDELIHGWHSLQQMEIVRQQSSEEAWSHVDVTMDVRMGAVSPLCDALMDKVCVNVFLQLFVLRWSATTPITEVLCSSMFFFSSRSSGCGHAPEQWEVGSQPQHHGTLPEESRERDSGLLLC